MTVEPDYIMLFLSMVNIIFLLIMLCVERVVQKGDLFSAGSFFIYFSCLPALSNLYFSINTGSFERNVFVMLEDEFKDYFYVHSALFLHICTMVFTYVGILTAYMSSNSFISPVLKKLLRFNMLDNVGQARSTKVLLIFSFIIFVLGIVAYLKFVSAIGGLVYLWANMNMRATANAGLGYLQTFFMFVLPLGGALLFYTFVKKKKRLYSLLTVIIVVFILGSLGSRGPALSFLISLLIFYHYKFKAVKTLLNPKLLAIYFLFPVIVVVLLQFRDVSNLQNTRSVDSLLSSSIKSLESGFIARVGRLERDVVIIKYFSENDFWWGRSYLGLLTAPIPKSLYPEKPPNDSGMYLKALSAGMHVTPPLATRYLSTSSWPEMNWIGYMNGGVVGLFLVFFISGYLTGKLYVVMVKSNSLMGCYLYSKLIVGGSIVLSVLPIINYLMYFFILNFLYYFIFLPLHRLCGPKC